MKKLQLLALSMLLSTSMAFTQDDQTAPKSGQKGSRVSAVKDKAAQHKKSTDNDDNKDASDKNQNSANKKKKAQDIKKKVQDAAKKAKEKAQNAAKKAQEKAAVKKSQGQTQAA